jgi:hypothetical protein
MASPRKGLCGYRCAYEDEPGSGTGIDEASATPAEWARFRRDQARLMLALAREKVAQAYAATRRYPRDPRWSRVDANPEARAHLTMARTALRAARLALALAAAAERTS